MSRGIRAGLIAVLATAVLAPSALADTTYPVDNAGNGNTFTNGAEGWTDAGKRCFIALLGVELPLPDVSGITPLACSVTNTHAAGQGNPPGSISSSFTAVANVIGL